MSPNFRTLENLLEQMIEGMRDCHEQGRAAPALMLLYSAIDTLSWLDEPRGREDIVRADFVHWIDEFITARAKGKLACTAYDLYAAWLGLIHNHSVESEMLRTGRARQLVYVWGPGDAAEVQASLDREGREAVAVHIGELIELFEQGALAYLEAVHRQPARAQKITSRLPTLLRSVPVAS